MRGSKLGWFIFGLNVASAVGNLVVFVVFGTLTNLGCGILSIGFSVWVWRMMGEGGDYDGE